MNFQYVLSGVCMISLEASTPTTAKIFNNYFETIDYEMALLYNAGSEKDFGVKFKDLGYTNSTKNIMVDSYGLQMVTLGLSKAEVKNLKPKIFANQATSGTIAMSFDDMPIEVLNSRSERLDLSGRLFVREKVQEAVKNTVTDLKAQIKIFQDLKSTCKIMIISQGNDLASYKEYIESIINALSPEELEYIQGIAPSGASNGFGGIQRFDMLYGLKEYEVPERLMKNIHLLGVGSASSLTPLTGSTDYFSFIDTLSFDSTSHSRKYKLGGTGMGGYQFPKDKSDTTHRVEYTKLVKRYYKYFSQIGSFDLDYLVENATYYSKKNIKDIWSYSIKEDEKALSLAQLIWGFSTFSYVEDIMNTLKENQATEQGILNNIKTYDDYLYYRKWLMHYYKLKSNKVGGVETFEDLNVLSANRKIMTDLF